MPVTSVIVKLRGTIYVLLGTTTQEPSPELIRLPRLYVASVSDPNLRRFSLVVIVIFMIATVIFGFIVIFITVF